MIVVVEPLDRRLSLDVLRRLVRCGCLSTEARILALDEAEFLRGLEQTEPIFVIASELVQLRVALGRLRRLTSRPLVAVSFVGAFAEMIAVLRAGAADFLDVCSSFEVDARRILNRLDRRQDASAVFYDIPEEIPSVEVTLHDGLGNGPHRHRRFISGS